MLTDAKFNIYLRTEKKCDLPFYRLWSDVPRWNLYFVISLKIFVFLLYHGSIDLTKKIQVGICFFGKKKMSINGPEVQVQSHVYILLPIYQLVEWPLHKMGNGDWADPVGSSL